MITNPLADGPHGLLSQGARLIAEPAQILDLLHEAGAPARVRATPPEIVAAAAAPAHLRRVLELVGAGIDTPERLATALQHHGLRDGVMAALGELEAIGALARSPSGRWVRRDPARQRGP